MGLNIDCCDGNGTVRCLFSGELDLASQAKALAALAPVIEQRPRTVVFDLSGVEFIDSTGLRVLLKCRRMAEEAKTRLLLSAPSEAVRRLFELTKLQNRFEFENLG